MESAFNPVKRNRGFWAAILLIYMLPLVLRVNGQNLNTDTIKSGNNNLGKAIGISAVYYGTSTWLMSNLWYKGRERVPFHFYNDNNGWMQVDKFGHAFGAYVYSYTGYHFMLNSGFSRKEALWFGASLGFMLQVPIEILDGIHEGYGFSTGDMMANFLGSAFVLSQELLFGEQAVKYKFSYRETGYARRANGFLGTTTLNRILKDYNGHTYWFSMPLNKVISREGLPEWLCLSVGYGAKGMYGEFENISEYKGVPIPETIRYRQLLVSPDIDWTRIKTDSGFLRTVFKALTFVKFPFPAVEFNSKGELNGYWFYY
jgi:hypothetical protein